MLAPVFETTHPLFVPFLYFIRVFLAPTTLILLKYLFHQVLIELH